MELRQGAEKPLFLSAHRCPEVDLLPHHDSMSRYCPPYSIVPVERSSKPTCAGECETNYLDVSPTHRSDRDEEDKDEDEESESDWSEEDLSLHFSPSVILQSEDDESDHESSFECVDVSMETLVEGKSGEGLKMVPKRQIQLKKKKKDDRNMQKLQVREESYEGGGANSEVCPPVRPDLLRRQHSLPASLHSTDNDSYRVYRGIIAGANQVPDGEGTLQRQRLQKSFSLDETKTKLASCIIKSILSKKMQVEKNTCGSTTKQNEAPVLPRLPPPTERKIREGPGGDTGTGGGVAKAPVHVVRDMRSLVKNTYSLSFSHKNKPTSFKVIGQRHSPPPTYQQAVGVAPNNPVPKGTNQASSCSNSCRGHVAKVAASFSQSQDRNQKEHFSRPVTQQRRSSEPMIRSKGDDVTWPSITKDLLKPSQSEGGRGRSPQAGAPILPSLFVPPPPSILIQPPPTAQDQSPVLRPSSHFIPCSSQQVLKPCFYPAQVLPVYPPTLQHHIGGVSYVSGPLGYIRTSMQPVPTAATSHLLRRSEVAESAKNTSDQVRCSESHVSESSAVTVAAQRQHEGPDNHEGPENHQNHEGPKKDQTHDQHELQQLQQQKFVCNLDRVLPAQVGNDFIVDIQGSASAPGALLGRPAHCHFMFDPMSGRFFFLDTPTTPQRKMLLDPETGQYVQVFLPVPGSAPNSSVFPVHGSNPTPIMVNPAHSLLNPNPSVIPVMQLQPTMAVFSNSRLPFPPTPHHLTSTRQDGGELPF